MLGVVPNAFAKFQKNSINIESGKNTRAEAGLCPILPINLSEDRAYRAIHLQDRSSKTRNAK